jgi:hypothetical protein
VLGGGKFRLGEKKKKEFRCSKGEVLDLSVEIVIPPFLGELLTINLAQKSKKLSNFK